MYNRKFEPKKRNSENKHYRENVSLPDKYKFDSYYDEKGELRSSLFSSQDNSIESLVSLITKNRGQLSSSQIRTFYNDIKAIERKINVEKGSFEKYRYQILLLRAKIYYYCAKKTSGKFYEDYSFFKEFMNHCISKINNEKDFMAFVKVFETFICFFKAQKGD